MSGSSHSVCRKNSWLAGLAGGVLVAAMLIFVAKNPFLPSVLVGAVVAVLLGLFFVWAFCTATAHGGAELSTSRPAEPAVPAEPAPAPQPVPVAAPAPAPETPPAPVAELAAPEPPAPAQAEAAAAAPKAVSAPAFITPVAARPPVVEPPAPEPAVEPKPAARKAARPRAGSALDAAVAKAKEPVATAGPELLTAPRGGKPDDLKLIKGVGPKLEKLLNEVGVWHFDQIASWKAKDIAIVDEKLDGFKGRISRDAWVKQAKVFARSGTAESSKRVARGGAN